MKPFQSNLRYLAFAVLLIVAAQFVPSFFKKSPSVNFDHFQLIFQNKEDELESLLQKFSGETGSEDLFSKNSDLLERLFVEKGLSVFVFENSEMIFWSDNVVPVLNYLILSELKGPVIRLQNGWYRLISRKEGNKTIVAMALIKNEFVHQNKFLKNEFQKDFKLPSDVSISLDMEASKWIIKDRNGNYFLTLVFPDNVNENNFSVFLEICIWILAFIFLIYFLSKEAERIQKTKPLLSFIILSGCLLFIRLMTLHFKFPGKLYQLEIFSPVHYATSQLFPSLGDMLINVILLAFLLYFFHRKLLIGAVFNDKTSLKLKPALAVIILFLPLFFGLVINELLCGLVIHSNINFELQNIFEINYLSFTGFFISAILLLSYFLLADKLVILLLRLQIDFKKLVQLSIFPLALYAISFILISDHTNLIFLLWPAVMLFIICLIRNRKVNSYSFSNILLIIFIFSVFASHNFNFYSSVKEQKNRKILIEKLAWEKDPVAEYLFRNIVEELQSDVQIQDLSKNFWQNKDILEASLREKYFSGFWNKYDIQSTACSGIDSIMVVPYNHQFNCINFFDSIIENYGQQVSNSLFFLNNNSGRISYLSRIPFAGTDKILFLEIDSKFMPEGTGYPELLLDSSEIVLGPEMFNYSFAKYKNGRLTSKTGNYSYSVQQEDPPFKDGDFVFFEKENYVHLAYNPDTTTLIILSKPTVSKTDKLSSFSYIFAFFSFLLLAGFFIRKIPRLKSYWYDFKTRVQTFIILTVILSILLFGAGTILYIQKQYKQKNEKNISEKISSVLIELEHKISGEPALSHEMEDYLSQYLIKFSHVFFSDINLYDLEGDLLSSSQKEIFESGLTGRKMNAIAFEKMAIENKTEFIHEENIGELNYLSAYVPLFNIEGDLLAFLNLPYFAKQNELEKEISFFLVALINIYVFLFVISVIVAIFLSNLITEPLQLIRSKLRDVKLGKSNELIEWKGKDEIGSLVSEYNRMVVELTESAERLAKSERESAWREMARQVAHEIKNPLTPMKLSIQHLQKAKKDNSPDFDKKLDRFTQTLIEQIDALTKIADEFSNFAKMPASNPEIIKLQELIKSVVNLFKGSEEAVISINFEITEPLEVFSDKSQLIRVINNLIKNALQSIPYEKEGKIVISLEKKNNYALITVEDNGTGISEEQKEKIFTPNFTTKTGGTGLGLAIVKNIIENSGGEIWFESEEKIGTKFFISHPLT